MLVQYHAAMSELAETLQAHERAWLRTLARDGAVPVERQDAALRRLCKEDYVIEDSARRLRIAVPMFTTWIQDEHV